MAAVATPIPESKQLGHLLRPVFRRGAPLVVAPPLGGRTSLGAFVRPLDAALGPSPALTGSPRGVGPPHLRPFPCGLLLQGSLPAGLCSGSDPVGGVRSSSSLCSTNLHQFFAAFGDSECPFIHVWKAAMRLARARWHWWSRSRNCRKAASISSHVDVEIRR